MLHRQLYWMFIVMLVIGSPNTIQPSVSKAPTKSPTLYPTSPRYDLEYCGDLQTKFEDINDTYLLDGMEYSRCGPLIDSTARDQWECLMQNKTNSDVECKDLHSALLLTWQDRQYRIVPDCNHQTLKILACTSAMRHCFGEIQETYICHDSCILINTQCFRSTNPLGLLKDPYINSTALCLYLRGGARDSENATAEIPISKVTETGNNNPCTYIALIETQDPTMSPTASEFYDNMESCGIGAGPKAYNISTMDALLDIGGSFISINIEVEAPIKCDKWISSIDHIPVKCSSIFTERSENFGTDSICMHDKMDRLLIYVGKDANFSLNTDIYTVDTEKWNLIRHAESSTTNLTSRNPTEEPHMSFRIRYEHQAAPVEFVIKGAKTLGPNEDLVLDASNTVGALGREIKFSWQIPTIVKVEQPWIGNNRTFRKSMNAESENANILWGKNCSMLSEAQINALLSGLKDHNVKQDSAKLNVPSAILPKPTDANPILDFCISLTVSSWIAEQSPWLEKTTEHITITLTSQTNVQVHISHKYRTITRWHNDIVEAIITPPLGVSSIYQDYEIKWSPIPIGWTTNRWEWKITEVEYIPDQETSFTEVIGMNANSTASSILGIPSHILIPGKIYGWKISVRASELHNWVEDFVIYNVSVATWRPKGFSMGQMNLRLGNYENFSMHDALAFWGYQDFEMEVSNKHYLAWNATADNVRSFAEGDYLSIDPRLFMPTKVKHSVFASCPEEKQNFCPCYPPYQCGLRGNKCLLDAFAPLCEEPAFKFRMHWIVLTLQLFEDCTDCSTQYDILHSFMLLSIIDPWTHEIQRTEVITDDYPELDLGDKIPLYVITGKRLGIPYGLWTSRDFPGRELVDPVNGLAQIWSKNDSANFIFKPNSLMPGTTYGANVVSKNETEGVNGLGNMTFRTPGRLMHGDCTLEEVGEEFGLICKRWITDRAYRIRAYVIRTYFTGSVWEAVAILGLSPIRFYLPRGQWHLRVIVEDGHRQTNGYILDAAKFTSESLSLTLNDTSLLDVKFPWELRYGTITKALSIARMISVQLSKYELFRGDMVPEPEKYIHMRYRMLEYIGQKEVFIPHINVYEAYMTMITHANSDHTQINASHIELSLQLIDRLANTTFEGSFSNYSWSLSSKLAGIWFESLTGLYHDPKRPDAAAYRQYFEWIKRLLLTAGRKFSYFTVPGEQPVVFLFSGGMASISRSNNLRTRWWTLEEDGTPFYKNSSLILLKTSSILGSSMPDLPLMDELLLVLDPVIIEHVLLPNYGELKSPVVFLSYSKTVEVKRWLRRKLAGFEAHPEFGRAWWLRHQKWYLETHKFGSVADRLKNDRVGCEQWEYTFRVRDIDIFKYPNAPQCLVLNPRDSELAWNEDGCKVISMVEAQQPQDSHKVTCACIVTGFVVLTKIEEPKRFEWIVKEPISPLWIVTRPAGLIAILFLFVFRFFLRRYVVKFRKKYVPEDKDRMYGPNEKYDYPECKKTMLDLGWKPWQKVFVIAFYRFREDHGWFGTWLSNHNHQYYTNERLRVQISQIACVIVFADFVWMNEKVEMSYIGICTILAILGNMYAVVLRSIYFNSWRFNPTMSKHLMELQGVFENVLTEKEEEAWVPPVSKTLQKKIDQVNKILKIGGYEEKKKTDEEIYQEYKQKEFKAKHLQSNTDENGNVVYRELQNEEPVPDSWLESTPRIRLKPENIGKAGPTDTLAEAGISKYIHFIDEFNGTIKHRPEPRPRPLTKLPYSLRHIAKLITKGTLYVCIVLTIVTGLFFERDGFPKFRGGPLQHFFDCPYVPPKQPRIPLQRHQALYLKSIGWALFIDCFILEILKLIYSGVNEVYIRNAVLLDPVVDAREKLSIVKQSEEEEKQ